MAFSYSPRIITDGLVLYLDAANTRSYPGSGTTWTDISRGGNTGTLINGPTFNSGNGGSIMFDGVDDYVTINNSNSLQFGNNFTINTWVYINNLNSRIGIFSTRTVNSTGSWQLEIGPANSGSNRIAITGVNTWIWSSQSNVIQTNTWYNIIYISLTNEIYLNSHKINPSLTTPYTILNNNELKIIGFGTSGGQLYNGKISQVSIYNRALSAQEIQQNYNATKTRYGL